MWPFKKKPEAKASKYGPLMTQISLGIPQWPERQFRDYAIEGYQQNPIVFACIIMIAWAVADVKIKIVNAKGENAENESLRKIIERANPMQDGISFREEIVSDYLLCGNAFIERVDLGGIPNEIYRLRPDLVQVVPGQDGFPKQYQITGPGGEIVRTVANIQKGKSSIIQIKSYSPLNLWFGQSPLDPGGYSIDSYTAANAWNYSLLQNSAQPSGALTYNPREGSQNLSIEAFEELKNRLKDTMMGQKNSGRPLVLEGGLEWQSIGMSPVDMAYSEGKASSARDIALCLGVPPLMLGIQGDNTYANYAEANKAFFRQTVLPHVNKLCGAFNWWFADAFPGLKLAPDEESIMAFADERLNFWNKIEDCNVLTVNEKRVALGYPPIEGGDVLLVPANMIPLESANMPLGMVGDETEKP